MESSVLESEAALRTVVVDPENGRPLSAQVCEQIEALIDAGALREGQRLPTTQRLAQIMGLSLQVTQDAAGKLAERDLIRRRRRLGTVVAKRPRTGTVGLLTSYDPRVPLNANFGWIIAHGFHAAIQTRDLNGQHYVTQRRQGVSVLPDSLRDDLRARRLDALLVGAIRPEIVAEQAGRHVTAPVIGLNPAEDERLASVQQSVRWLWQQSCREAAIVLTEPTPRTEQVFLDACARFGIKVSPSRNHRGLRSGIDEGRALCERIRAAGAAPDGMLVLDDMLAYGLLERAADTGMALDPSRVTVLVNKGSSLHIPRSCPTITLDWAAVVDRALAGLTLRRDQAYSPPPHPIAHRPVYSFEPPEPAAPTSRKASGSRS